MDTLTHSTREEIEAALARAGTSPADRGVVEMIVARPRENERTVLERGRLDAALGLEGDCWHSSLVNSTTGRQHCMRGINAFVVRAGEIAVGDAISKA